jgi:hypothetical protein
MRQSASWRHERMKKIERVIDKKWKIDEVWRRIWVVKSFFLSGRRFTLFNWKYRENPYYSKFSQPIVNLESWSKWMPKTHRQSKQHLILTNSFWLPTQTKLQSSIKSLEAFNNRKFNSFPKNLRFAFQHLSIFFSFLHQRTFSLFTSFSICDEWFACENDYESQYFPVLFDRGKSTFYLLPLLCAFAEAFPSKEIYWLIQVLSEKFSRSDLRLESETSEN